MKKAALYVAILFLASSAFGFSLNGRKWFTSSDARFFLNNANGPGCCLTPSQQSSQILSGITPWAIASSGGTTNLSGAKRDGQNVISWGRLGGTTLGVTNYISTDTSQSQICNGVAIFRFVEVDVRFNNQFNWQTSSTCTNGFDLAGVSTHEFGHAVGLGHSNVSGATMFPSVAACDFSVSSLANDDKAGYSSIYSGCN
ncbi:MAG TPA: matrixin family metalloprotease [Thermoanaerobaculia bacterium]|nr:matrixin family metalloprotease [Thermoanaerobaculia bacterium]